MWIKVRHFLKEKYKYIPRGINTKWIKSTYEEGVANRGRNKGEIMVLGGAQIDIGWW